MANNLSDLNEMKKYMGNTYQVFGTRQYKLVDGNNAGVRAIDVKTGGGLEYTILPDRGLDISLASYKGVNLTYLTPQGEVNPAHYNCKDDEWLRTFFGGLMSTCGPDNIGSECRDGNVDYGLHGRHNVTPAKNVCDLSPYTDSIKVMGQIENTVLFGDKIRVTRTIESKLFRNEIRIVDQITNIGIDAVPMPMLYHINFGYPLLSETSQIIISSDSVKAQDAYSNDDIEMVNSFGKPDKISKEKNYFYKMKNIDGYGYCAIVSKSVGNFGVYIKQRLHELPYMSQWKIENDIDYALALEPCNTMCLGREQMRKKSMLPLIKPSETVSNEVIIGVFEHNSDTINFENFK